MLQNDYVLLLDELRLKLLDVKPQIDDLADAIGLNPLKEELSQLEGQTAQEGFWNDLAGTQKILQRISRIKDEISSYQKLASAYEDVMTLVELGMDSPEESEATFEEAKLEYNALMDELETKKLATLLKGEYDGNNAILAFHAGAGGLEAQDWAQMLYRMYTRWAERHGYKCKVLDYLSGEEGGVKSASILIEGENAYGFLKSEAGVHRLVRISPFDSSGRRHTSFASLEVMPEITDEDNEIVINDADLKIDTYRSGGAGGQHVNKTESAIRITHIPTGVVVACQNERSQHQNREVAMKMLKSKLIEIKERAHLERIEDIKGEQKDIGFGNQIRSYVFMPYTLVKDHRTGFESGNITAVMDGDIDGFINAYLKAESLGHLLENE
ncbi:peptide chain release factor 2 [Merdimmobilis hominis]|uniref:Peptide chain release factor 2 n=1 Tax=uncultured Anaerotruncus sp. TaxID=905011 RepID=A0A6N2S530_9FIRM|nr:peptide chain release factor 2 [Merdimmobilis hominis]MCD4836369.1 peptide chain release factor 2 [Merdimmobilis hominis]PWL63091.1 MAG: peptide chain release factor 2 [Oscillospiraceae bacterium]